MITESWEEGVSQTASDLPLADTLPDQILTVRAHRQLRGFKLDVKISVPAGFIVLFGPSGAGKSMTLQALAGLCPLDHACITLGNQIWHDSKERLFVPPQQRHIGYVPQNYALFPHLTVAQNIAFGMTIGRSKNKEYVASLIHLMQLDGLERLRPAQLSGGQQQRVALARALAIQPRLLLLDEPFSSLDAPIRETLREELRAFHERVHIPLVLVTHDVQEARLLADTIVVLQDGQVLQVGATEAVFTSPRTANTARLLGMNICWQGKIVRWINQSTTDNDANNFALIQVANLTLRARIPSAYSVHLGQHVQIGIRTEELRVFTLSTSQGDREYAEQSSTPSSFSRGVITRDQPQGFVHKLSVVLDCGLQIDVPVMQRDYRELRLGAGDEIGLDIPPEAVCVFDPGTKAE
jgi:molybdate transport system ATP-binding protein